MVVPKWLMSGRQGIGGKLTGIGVYVQPLGEGMDKERRFVDDVVEDTAREQVRSRRFMAPYFYVQVTTLDAKTLKVIKERIALRLPQDRRQGIDRTGRCRAVHPGQLASHMQRFVENIGAESRQRKGRYRHRSGGASPDRRHRAGKESNLCRRRDGGRVSQNAVTRQNQALRSWARSSAPPTLPPESRHFSLSDFDYALPPELIAQFPLPERSASRLLDGRGDARLIAVFVICRRCSRRAICWCSTTRGCSMRGCVLRRRVVARSDLVERLLSPTLALTQLRASHAPKPGTRLTIVGRAGSPVPAEVTGRRPVLLFATARWQRQL